ncbi:IS1595 family transposase [Sphingomonas edaphi]|uniref:IS1595 family transposase n=2 Tax=Sphingomonas edaphi TaxID=2315689 RepID=A0A418PYL4_9SPHN|nr:IS1595 family transposase [Sphingomonas edaphi]RIX27251.1 IS1595 family transposase [Sphingomonas edaphi]
MTQTLRQFQDRFPTEEACLDHLFQVRYGTDFECPKCGRPAKYSRVKARRSYQCNWCAHQVYPTAGTPFDRTRTSLRDWFYVMFLFTTTRNGVAAKRVQREIGVTYKTAWRMCHEVRKYMAQVDGDDALGGPGEVVEIDETYVGGKEKGQGSMKEKTIVLGMMERDGAVTTRVIENVRRVTLFPHICENVLPGSIINTDELVSYKSISLRGYRHQTVNHREGRYVSDYGATVNSIEGFWALLKRGIHGTHIHVSPKHLSKYLGEFEFRWNHRHTPHLMLDRLLYSFTR